MYADVNHLPTYEQLNLEITGTYFQSLVMFLMSFLIL